MKYALFYDTETTGKPEWGEPSDSEIQPHIVQLAAKLVNLEDRSVMAEMNALVKPDGWIIPDEVIEIHGITNEHAAEHGIPEEEAVQQFFAIWSMANDQGIRVGHNETFDRRLIRIATKRYESLAPFIDPWKDLAKDRSYCTMHKFRAAVGLGKVPTLGEAYKHFTGDELEGAHDAMADVDGCIAVYWGVQDTLEVA